VKQQNTVSIAAALAAFMLMLCGVAVVLPLLGAQTAQAFCQPAPQQSQPSDTTWTEVQRQHATTIVATGSQRGIPPRGWVIALATAMQESSLHNLANSSVAASLHLPHDGTGKDHDSVGLFQQRPNPPDGQGSWGTVAELMDPATSAGKFYGALLKVEDWQTMQLTVAAQHVQRSGTPLAYQKWEHAAELLAASIAGVPDIGQIGGGPPHAPCGTEGIPPGTVGPDGWIQPVHAPVGDKFGAPRPNNRTHAGVDLIASRNTPIRAIAAGTVTKILCQSSTGTCDSDGSSQATGCGWYTEVTHPVSVSYQGNPITSVVSRYCHLASHPAVQIGQTLAAGDVLGYVGSSGGSSGPHLHFEIHVRREALSTEREAYEPVDPVAFLAQRGVKLGAA
jgi:murein DD-endopeptidase MepM/ murein hydrolase activator NlpD